MKEDYDSNFSKFYDKYLTGQASRYADFDIGYLEKRVSGRNIVDLMCGTGTLLKAFQDSNWNTTGVDLSEDMLNLAKKKLDSTKLINSDVSNVELKKEYDAVVCTADSINHLPTLGTVQKTFTRVSNALKKDGYFIFDVNTELGLYRNCTYITSSDEYGLAIREGFYDEVHKIGFTRFQGFFKQELDESYLRFDSKIYNYLYNIEDLKKVIWNSKLTIVDVLDDYSESSTVKDSTERITFICKK